MERFTHTEFVSIEEWARRIGLELEENHEDSEEKEEDLDTFLQRTDSFGSENVRFRDSEDNLVQEE